MVMIDLSKFNLHYFNIYEYGHHVLWLSLYFIFDRILCFTTDQIQGLKFSLICLNLWRIRYEYVFLHVISILDYLMIWLHI